MEIWLPIPAHTLLKMMVVKRTKLRIVRLTFLLLLLCSAFVATATADDTKPDVAPAKPAEKEATQIKKEGAEPKTEAAVPETEDPKAKLLAMFKKQESITNTLGMVMVWVPIGYRVSRYEATLWRQVGRILLALDALDRRKPQERRPLFRLDDIEIVP